MEHVIFRGGPLDGQERDVLEPTKIRVLVAIDDACPQPEYSYVAYDLIPVGEHEWIGCLQ